MQDTVGQTRQATLDASGRPAISWGHLVVLLVWSAIEGTIFAFGVRPTMTELIGDLTGLQINPIALLVLLSIFLTIIVAGSFGCIQVLTEAIQTKDIGNIGSMIAVQITIAIFQVLFLYGGLVDATKPWLAEAGITLGVVGTLGLASLAWVAVRGMTWFLFGRSGAPALNALLSKRADV